MLKLLDEFSANPLIDDHKSGETILHTACRMNSDLRFYIANRFPDLLRKRNMKSSGAEQPLHVACSMNDIKFVSWLFKNLLAQEGVMDEVVGMVSTKKLPLPRCESWSSGKTNRVKLVHQNTIDSSTSRMQHNRDRYAVVKRARQTVLRANVGIQRTEIENSDESNRRSPTAWDPPNRLELSVDSYRSSSYRSDLDVRSRSFERSPSPVLHPEMSLPSSLMSRQVTQTLQSVVSDIQNESPLTVSEVCELLPSLTSNGDSAFHILARLGYTELLTSMLKVAEFLLWRINLTMFVHRFQPGTQLPIEEAIDRKHIKCVQVILHFMNISGLLSDLLHDKLLLECVVRAADLDTLKLLISYGFHKGLDVAILRAIYIKNDEILRVLLYYQTEVINALEFSHVTRNHYRALHHNNGGIKWEGLQLEHIHPSWLYDCYNAIDSVSKTYSLVQVLLSTDDNHDFFQQLGDECLSYFSTVVSSSIAQQPSHHLAVITKVNLNKNQLTEVPVELFQLPALRVLQLCHNNLTSLPSSGNSSETLYTALISVLKLDHNQLSTIPEDLFRDLSHSLTEMTATWNSLQDLPPGLWVCPKLKLLKLGHNQLSRLHYLSLPKYFDDRTLSATIISLFTVEEGTLICNSTNSEESMIRQIAPYMYTLADYRRTVCAVKFPLDPSLSSPNNTMYDIMGIHLSRNEFYRTSFIGQRPRTASTPTIQGEALFQILDDGEEKETVASVLEELDLSHNSFSEFPWDLACVAPKLKKLHIENNHILELDIVHDIPCGLETLFIDANKISILHNNRQPSLPCAHPFRLLTTPEIRNSHDKYCLHCKHESLDNLLLLSANKNHLSEFLATHVPDDASTSVKEQPLYPNLSILSLEDNRLKKFPICLHHLTKLSAVKLSRNQICELPPEAGLLNSQQLYVLKLDGMNIRNVPPHLLQKTTPKLLLNYLKAIQQKYASLVMIIV